MIYPFVCPDRSHDMIYMYPLDDVPTCLLCGEKTERAIPDKVPDAR